MQITQVSDMQRITYILNADNMFFPTGYKVLKTQQTKGFVSCYRVLHNGRDKLIYDISEYDPMGLNLPSLDPGALKRILLSLADVAEEVKSNGFMQCENVMTTADRIFVDRSSSKVYLIYLPVTSISGPNSFTEFERKLKHSIMECIGLNPHVRDFEIEEACRKMADPNCSLISTLKSIGGQDIYYDKKEETKPAFESHSPASMKQKAVKKPQKVKKEKPEKERGIFGRRKEKSDFADRQKPENEAECAKTELLGDPQIKNIAFCGIQTPVNTEFLINKPEFSIGKRADIVDGAITFNDSISRIHCKIIKENGKHYLVDLGSANGSFVNGEKAVRNAKIQISPGDKIKLANSNFLIKAV